MAKQTVTLQPGESQVVTFQYIPSVVKTHQVSVDGLMGSFEAIPVGFGPKGDVNGSGTINKSDVNALQMLLEDQYVTVTLQALLKSADMAKSEGRHNYVSSIEAVFWRCDINGDGVIDDRDLALLEEIVGYRWRDLEAWTPIYY